MRRAALLICAALASPAAAQTFGLPAGCAAYVTVQKRGCIVSHLFTCAGDPEGHQRRVDLAEDGPIYLGMIDAETRWIESNHVLAGTVERLRPGASDPASFSTLLATGTDSFDFMTESDAGILTRFVGQDDLTGEVETIDGVALDVTRFRVSVRDPQTGAELWRTEGREYIHRDWRTFISGIRTVVLPDETFDRDNRPVEFAFPGDPGFLSSTPRQDCGVMLSDTPRPAASIPMERI